MEDTIQRAMEMLEALATKIGTTVGTLWPHAVRYEAMSALVTIAGWFIALALSVVFAWYYRREPWWWNSERGRDEKPSVKLLATLAAAFFLIGFSMAVGFNLPIVLEPTGYLTTRILRGIP